MGILTGEIRFIQWGVIPGLPYRKIEVGQSFGGTKTPMRVLDIIKESTEEKSYYHVQCSLKDKDGNLIGEPFIWITFNKEPDEVQHFAPDEKHNYVFAR